MLGSLNFSTLYILCRLLTQDFSLSCGLSFISLCILTIYLSVPILFEMEMHGRIISLSSGTFMMTFKFILIITVSEFSVFYHWEQIMIWKIILRDNLCLLSILHRVRIAFLWNLSYFIRSPPFNDALLFGCFPYPVIEQKVTKKTENPFYPILPNDFLLTEWTQTSRN